MRDRHGNPVPLTKLLDVPPLWLAGTLVAEYLLHRIAPIGDLTGLPGRIAAAVLILTALFLLLWSARTFSDGRTPIHPRRKPRTLLTSGPFAHSRNPIYLAMVLIALGAALWLGSFLPLVCPFVFAWIVTRRFIHGEEHHIEREFGDDWRAYAARVRRWL